MSVDTAPDQAQVHRPPKPPPNFTLWIGLAIVAAITWWSATQIGFSLQPLIENFDNGSETIGQFLRPDWGFILDVKEAWMQTLYIAIVAGMIGNGAALFFALLASKVSNPNRAGYLTFKTLLSVLRSLPDVAYALFFVAAVGSGPLAGVLALILFNLGVNAKLTSETIDGVDVGPLEAADASGGNRIQRAFSAIVPQVMPNYVSYCLYVFELNVRASVVIGLVGAGGIGQVIIVQFSRFNFDKVGAIVAALFVVVFTLDRLSVWFRRRLV